MARRKRNDNRGRNEERDLHNAGTSVHASDETDGSNEKPGSRAGSKSVEPQQSEARQRSARGRTRRVSSGQSIAPEVGSVAQSPSPQHRLISLKRKAQREGWAKYIRSENDERAVLNGCWVDLRKADYVKRFFGSFLTHSKGSDFAGRPFTLLPWQEDRLFIPLFGWQKRDSRGRIMRRFRKAYVEVPKKQGKSTIASGIALFMLVADGEPGAEVYSIANTKHQGSIIFKEALNMAKASPELRALLKFNEGALNIAFPATRSLYRVLSGNPRSNEGWNASCILADELHEWRGARGRALYDAIRYAFAARHQPLFFQITTAGEDTLSVCYEQHQYALAVANDRLIDEQFFPLVYAADPSDDPWSEATWRKANPSLGETISFEGMAADANEAKQTGLSQARFKRYRLNIWTTGDSPWIDINKWRACEVPPRDMSGKPCYVALDLSRTQDSTSVQALFPLEGDAFYLQSYFWLPEARARELTGSIPWDIWATQGHVFLIPGEVVEFGPIEDFVVQFAQRHQILQMAFDNWMAADVIQRIENQSRIATLAFHQSARNFSSPTAEFERLIRAKRILHPPNPTMEWMMQNAVVTTDSSGNIRVRKPQQTDNRKVDGPVAAVMTVGLALAAPVPQSSFYQTNEMEFG